jgi:hypothetical protein
VSGPASAGLTVTLSRALLLVAGGARLLRCACLDSRPMPNGGAKQRAQDEKGAAVHRPRDIARELLSALREGPRWPPLDVVMRRTGGVSDVDADSAR